MDILDPSDDEQEQSGSRRLGSRFGKRRAKRRTGGQRHLLLMDCVGGSDNGDASEETVPLPAYERLSQSARLPHDPDSKDAPPLLTPVQKQQQTPPKWEASPPQTSPTQQQKPAAWRLIEYVRSRHRASGGGVGSDGDSKSSDGEKEDEDGGDEGKKDKKIKKRSSWMPDPDRRWPVQGFY